MLFSETKLRNSNNFDDCCSESFMFQAYAGKNINKTGLLHPIHYFLLCLMKAVPPIPAVPSSTRIRYSVGSAGSPVFGIGLGVGDGTDAGAGDTVAEGVSVATAVALYTAV